MEIDFKAITQMVSESSNIPYGDIMSNRRFPHITSAKFLSIYFIRKNFPVGVCSKKRISDFFGVTHAMVNHAVKQVKNGLKTRDEFYETYWKVHKRIYYYFKKRDINLNEIVDIACRMPQF